MGNVIVGRYSDPDLRKEWQGWIEPEDKSWIMFVDGEGRPVILSDRDPATGAVQ